MRCLTSDLLNKTKSLTPTSRATSWKTSNFSTRRRSRRRLINICRPLSSTMRRRVSKYDVVDDVVVQNATSCTTSCFKVDVVSNLRRRARRRVSRSTSRTTSTFTRRAPRDGNFGTPYEAAQGHLVNSITVLKVTKYIN